MFNLTVTAIVAYLTLAGLLFTIGDLNKLKKENKMLRKDIENLKKRLNETK